MSTRTATQYGALAGMVIGGFAITITPRPGVGGIIGMMVVAIVIPVLIIYQAGKR